jgi:hypothetical protein
MEQQAILSLITYVKYGYPQLQLVISTSLYNVNNGFFMFRF